MNRRGHNLHRLIGAAQSRHESMEATAQSIVANGGNCQVPNCPHRAMATRTTWDMRCYAVCGSHASPIVQKG